MEPRPCEGGYAALNRKTAPDPRMLSLRRGAPLRSLLAPRGWANPPSARHRSAAFPTPRAKRVL